eukprot:Phypoly_transcript_06586.p1 GENE.Phypoly_transcript_06586~~Phypoly_transcript_06586.p1  ORF type:complete len:567 (+),score=80.28 Phypoly_transcript_06586:177-1703(+)
MGTPRGLFMMLCGAVTIMVILSVNSINANPDLAIKNTTTSIQITPINTSGDVENVSTAGNWGGDDFGLESESEEEPQGGEGKVETPPIEEVIDTNLAERKKRMEELGAIEQANVANYKNGFIGIYPTSGIETGGTTITFLFAIQNDSVAGKWPPQGFFGGCIVDGEWVPLVDAAFFSPSQVFLLNCKTPPHTPGIVEVAFLIDNVTRYVDNGSVWFTYTSAAAAEPPVTELALCTVMQDQGIYLREWIAFHTIFGVTKFYLYDQSSNEDWKADIQDFIDSGLVETYRWKFPWLVSIRHQAIGFWHAIKTFGLRTTWIGFTDVDEFLFIPKAPGQPVPSLTKFLTNFSDVGGVMVDRINFGPNGHKTRPPGLVIESYTKRTTITESGQPGKSIVQPKHVRWAGCGGVHTFDMEKGWLNVDGNKQTRENGCGIPYKNVVWDPIRINHYWTKSAQDWAERQMRDGKVYPIPAEELLEKWNYFTEDDTDIIAYAEETKRRMLWGVDAVQVRK